MVHLISLDITLQTAMWVSFCLEVTAECHGVYHLSGINCADCHAVYHLSGCNSADCHGVYNLSGSNSADCHVRHLICLDVILSADTEVSFACL